MVEGIDYSWAGDSSGFIPTSLIVAAGKKFVVRYLGNDDTGENITAAEVRSLLAAGVEIALVWQTTRSFMISNRTTGQSHAAIANAQAAAVGAPDNCGIYFSLDTDPNVLSSAQWSQVQAYLQGCADVLGLSRVGIYGGRLAIDKMVPTYARYGWQTLAWSGGVWSSKAHLQQYKVNTTLNGYAVDLDRAGDGVDFGQWPREEDMPTAAEVAAAVWKEALVNPADGSTSPASEFLRYLHKHVFEGRDEVRKLKGKLDALSASGVVVDYAQVEAAVEVALKQVLGALS